MPQLIWSASALKDIARLYRFLAPKSPEAASRAIAAIRQGTKLLGRHPQAGYILDDLPSAFREWPIRFGSSGYVARYYYDGKQLIILAIRHGREAGYE